MTLTHEQYMREAERTIRQLKAIRRQLGWKDNP
jgi:hypothetical protein